MKNKNLDLDPSQIHFLPLGGSEQFGVNFNLYAHAGKWLAVDCGIGFADHRWPGVDILLPDVSFIADRHKDLSALIVTHAHEDHVGAVPYLWPRLRCPIYCTEFTAAVLRRKLDEMPESAKAPITVVKPGDSVKIGPFTVHFLHVTHSIPDTVALAIETKAGIVLHSGDWNLDNNPVLNGPTDEAALKAFGRKGVMAYVGDSTNAEVPGRAGSESEVEKGLSALFAECPGRIAVTTFASNIGRMRSVVKAAKANGRRVALVGRSLHAMAGAAYDCGYLEGLPDFVGPDDIDRVPDEKLVLMVTGSQGEPRAALSRIARGENEDILLGRGDTVIFSSRAIPGNEPEINAVKNNLAAAGVTVITPSDTEHKIHASGHPCREEIAQMYQWLKPGLVVPVHGERTQLEAQAAWARACQIENVIVPVNGAVIRLGPDRAEVIDQVETSVLAVEPKRLIDASHPAIAERRKLQFTGVIHITLVMNGRGLAAAPQISTAGLIDPAKAEEARIEKAIRGEVEDILSDMERGDLADDHAVQEEVRIGVRRLVLEILGMKPKTTVHVVRV